MSIDDENDLSNILIDDDNDLSNILIDGEINLNSSLNFDLLNENESTTKSSKPLLKCVVCGDSAFGYNFDAISCESCKAFFRRNALRPTGRLKCRGNAHCEINVQTRKRCKKCRLDKCFRMGMRKEWILSDEEKRRKKHKIEENRRRKQSHEPIQHRIRRSKTNSRRENSSSCDRLSPRTSIDDSMSLMTELDWSKIHQIQTAYREAMAYNQVVGVPPYPATHSISSTVDLIQVPTYLSSIRLITYLKKTPDFDLFDSEDRVTLVKHNLLVMVFMHIVLIYDPIADIYHERDTQDPIFQGKDWIKILGEDFYHDLTATAKELIRVLEYDRVIVKLLLIIICYIKGFCSYNILHEPSLNNPSIVFNTQNIYVEILYKYCLHQYGLTRTINLFTNLIKQLFAIQSLAVHLKGFVHSITIDASQLSPVMQSVLQLSDSP